MATHPVEIVFAAIIGTAFVQLVRITSRTYFFGDDWKLLLQGESLGGMLEPYNGHLSVTILGVYRILIEVFGFSYRPFQVLGLLALLAVPAAYFLTTRRVLGPPMAAIAALSLLGFAEMELNPAWFNHYLALVGGIGCAAALNRGRRADLALTAALALSLSAAGGGVAVAAACLVHNACTRAPMRRWLAALGPSVLWGCWWLLAARGNESQFRAAGQPSVSESLGFARDVVWGPFDHLGLGNPLLAVALVLAFVGYGLWSLRQGLAAAANFLAWSSAMWVWGAGLALARGPYGIYGEVAGVSFRYQLLALGFALLAIVPRRPIRWPERFPPTTSSRWPAVAGLMILAVGGAGSMTIRDDVEDRARMIGSFTRITTGEMVVLGLGPGVIPDDAALGANFFWLSASDVRTVLRRYNHPFRSTPATADQRIVALGSTISNQHSGRRDLQCRPLTEPLTWLPEIGRVLYLSSNRATWTVYVRRFGTEWVKIDDVEANRTLALYLPPLGADPPWQVSADGACRVGPPRSP